MRNEIEAMEKSINEAQGGTEMGAQGKPEPKAGVGDALDQNLEIIHVGDIVHWDQKPWRVAEVNPPQILIEPMDGSSNSIAIAGAKVIKNMKDSPAGR